VIKPGDLVKHHDAEFSPVPTYRDEIGFVKAYDKRGDGAPLLSFVEVVWLPYRHPRCKTFHATSALKKVEQ